MSDLYETDFAAWSAAQARAIREAGAHHVNEPIDWENVAEEIEDLGKSVRRELRSRIGTIIEHLLKLEASPATEPQASWRTTVLRNRMEVIKLLNENPSLRREIPQLVQEELVGNRQLVRALMIEHDERPIRPLDQLNYDAEQVTGHWLPERRSSSLEGHAAALLGPEGSTT